MSSNDNAAKGPGLARGPALILGAILAGFGLVLFLKAGDTPTSAFPDGAATGPRFLGFETNGWTAWFTTAAGALLLFGAAQHLLAKTMSLIVGLALAACAIIALIDGDVLGLAAANVWTIVGWGAAAVLLLFNVLSPRIDHDGGDDGDHGAGRFPRSRERRTEPVAVRRPQTDGTSTESNPGSTASNGSSSSTIRPRGVS